MTCDVPNWRLLKDCARDLTIRGVAPFSRQQLIDCVRVKHPDRERSTLDPIIQGMTENARGGPGGRGSGTFRRVDRGLYELIDGAGTHANRISRQTVDASYTSSNKRRDASDRPAAVIARFEACLDAYDAQVPFRRAGQRELHAATIDLRRRLGSAIAAIDSPLFVGTIHSTLQAWGLGRRGSKLAGLSDFHDALVRHRDQIGELDSLSIDDPHLPADTESQLFGLISDLGVVENTSKLVAGTKTLHHLLPDLVVPIDVRWTGTFFGWPNPYFLSRQRAIFSEALSAFVEIARATSPQNFVGPGWRTSRTKLVDNALIGYCLLEGITPPGTGAGSRTRLGREGR